MSNQRDVQETLCNAMSVRDLISMLQDVDQEASVVFVCNYGDHHSTQQALCVQTVEETETKNLSTSAYSQSGIALNDSDNDDEEAYCNKCDEFYPHPMTTCPECKDKLVNEDGTDADSDDGQSVVVLS